MSALRSNIAIEKRWLVPDFIALTTELSIYSVFLSKNSPCMCNGHHLYETLLGP